MKKFFFSLLLIGTFTAYSVYVDQSVPSATAPTAVVTTQQIPATPIEVAANPAPVAEQILPVQAPTPTIDRSQLQAQGQVLLTNSSSAPITLIKTTRLLTPDGKLFRLAQTSTVPAHGQTRVEVYADQNGPAYAVSPTTFSIPGLTASLQPYITASSDATFVMAQPITAVAESIPAPAPTSAPAPTPVVSPQPIAKPKGQYVDGTYTGNSVDAYYGYVQVAAIISGGKITDVRFLDHPQDRSRSILINEYAMPRLTTEAIQAQSANVDAISGASATSGAFVQSLASALAQAKN